MGSNKIVSNSVDEFDYQKYDEMLKFENKYEEIAYNKLSKYEDICCDIEDVFENEFDIGKRMEVLKKAVKAFDNYKDYCYSKGYAGETYFNGDEKFFGLDHSSYLDKNYVFVPSERNFEDGYTSEYEGANFQNIYFLKNLLKEYEDNKEAVKNHLHEEEIYWGGEEKAADNKLEQYENVCCDIESVFENEFDIGQRIKILKKAIKTFDDYKNYCYSQGQAVQFYFYENAGHYLDESYVFVPIERDFQSSYVSEYEGADFYNVCFLKELLKEYEESKELIKKHLHEEEIYYYGGQEKYDFMLKVKNLRKNILKALKKNDGILQTEFYMLFDSDLKPRIMTELQALERENLIIRQKHGSTYKLLLSNPVK